MTVKKKENEQTSNKQTTNRQARQQSNSDTTGRTSAQSRQTQANQRQLKSRSQGQEQNQGQGWGELPPEQEDIIKQQYLEEQAKKERINNQIVNQESFNKQHDEAFSNYGANGDGITQAIDSEGNIFEFQIEKAIGTKEVQKAGEILQKYKTGKANLENRIIENEQWWKLRHWAYINAKTNKGENDDRIKPVSAWLFNSIANKHADAMDNYPEPNVLPRKREDEETAKILGEILPIILEHNNYEKVYSDAWWYKLKNGASVKGIFWNNSKENGMGDIEIRKIDILNLFWEPGISDIQDSPNLFHVALVSNEELMQQYPDLRLDASNPSIDIAKYIYDDTVDTSGKSAVVDWFYKKHEYQENNLGIPVEKTILHYCKYVNGHVLYASENDPNFRDRGWYDHGLYPFVVDSLYLAEGTPIGFGFIDVMRDPQMYIDKLQQGILENVMASASPRYAVRDDSGINIDDLTDYSKKVIQFPGGLGDDAFRQINAASLSSVYEAVMKDKISELKETSGNTAVSQGSTESGVTAASAIAALQEASGKLSRDMIKQTYRSFTEECYMVIELIRQFYNAPRAYRLTGEGGQPEYVDFSNEGLKPQTQGEAFGIDFGSRLPIFDIKVVAAKKSSYTKMSQNELALQFYQLQFFNPQNADATLSCLSMMDFDDKDKVIEMVKQNGTMLQTIQGLQQTCMAMAAQIDAMSGGKTNLVQQLAQGTNVQQSMAQSQDAPQLAETEGETQATKAANKAAEAASPR